MALCVNALFTMQSSLASPKCIVYDALVNSDHPHDARRTWPVTQTGPNRCRALPTAACTAARDESRHHFGHRERTLRGNRVLETRCTAGLGWTRGLRRASQAAA